MKIFNQLPYIARHLELEGNTLVERPDAELCVLEENTHTNAGAQRVLSGYTFPLSLLGLPLSRPTKDIFYLSSFWHEGKWHPQMLLAIPLQGLMNENLGAAVTSGLCSRYLPRTDEVDMLFSLPSLQEELHRLEHRGFVSFCLDAHTLRVVNIQTGPPTAFGYVNFFEGLRTIPVRTFLTDPFSVRLYENWVISLLVSVWPSPYKPSEGSTFDLSFSQERRFWTDAQERLKRSFLCTGGVLGVSAGFGYSLMKANQMALATPRELQTPMLQYRTDAHQEAARVFDPVRALMQNTS